MTASTMSSRLLLDELAAAGWGQLRGRDGHATRHVLTALVRGAGARHVLVASANQVADRAGVSERHARRCLHLLESMGLLSWTRGHIQDGRPRPGWFRVRIGALRQLVAHARAQARERLQRRRADTRHRINTTVRQATLWPRQKQQTPLSDRADMTSTLPLREGKGTPSGRRPPAVDTPTSQEGTAMHLCAAHDIPIDQCALCRKTLRERPNIDVKSLYKPAHTDKTSTDAREVARRGLAAARAALRQGKHTQETLA